MNTRSKLMTQQLSHSLNDERTIKLISVGLLDITLTLKLSSEFFEMNGINFDNIECVSDLTFLSKCRILLSIYFKSLSTAALSNS